MEATKVVLGIDLGGTKTAFGFVNKKGKCYGVKSIPTNSHQPAKDLVKRIYDVYSDWINKDKEKYQVVGIGIGAPNGNYFKGTIENPPNLHWGTTNMVELIERVFDLQAVLTNDANAAAIGEQKFGAGKNLKNFIVITLGTGLGSGIVVDGRLVYGHDGFAGELGHMVIRPNGRLCGCGRRGCLETYASVSGIIRTVFELQANLPQDSKLRKIAYHDPDGEQIYKLAKAGDPLALKAFDETTRILGEGLATSVAHLSPEAIILFGGLSLAKEFIFEPTKKYLEENLLTIFKNKVRIIPSALPPGDAAVMGAAALMWHELSLKKDNPKEK
jgi:glucokinase